MALALCSMLLGTAWLGPSRLTARSIRSAPLVGRLDFPAVDEGYELIGGTLLTAPPADREEEEEELVGEPRAATDTRPTPRPSLRQWLGRRYWVLKPGEKKPEPPTKPAPLITIIGRSVAQLREQRAAQIRANTAAIRGRLTAVGYTTAAATKLLKTPWMRSALHPLPGRDGACVALLQYNHLHSALKTKAATKAALRRNAQLLLVRECDLGARLATLCNATGLSAQQLVLSQPGLLSLEHTRVAQRVHTYPLSVHASI